MSCPVLSGPKLIEVNSLLSKMKAESRVTISIRLGHQLVAGKEVLKIEVSQGISMVRVYAEAFPQSIDLKGIEVRCGTEILLGSVEYFSAGLDRFEIKLSKQKSISIRISGDDLTALLSYTLQEMQIVPIETKKDKPKLEVVK